MSRVTEIEWLRALHFAEVRLPIKNLNDALHKASRKLWKRVGTADHLTVAWTFVPMRLDQGQLQVSSRDDYNLHMEITALNRTEGSYILSVFLLDGTLRLKVAEVHLDELQDKSRFGTCYKDAEVGNTIVQVMHTYARQQVERLGLT